MTNPTIGKLVEALQNVDLGFEIGNLTVHYLPERIAKKLEPVVIAWALETVGEDEVFTNDKVHSIKQSDRKFIIHAKQRNLLRAEIRAKLTGGKP